MLANLDLALIAEINAFNSVYGLTIDDDRLEQWPEFFTENCLYQVIGRENVDDNLPAAIMYCEGRGMLTDRIVAQRRANIYPMHYSRHLIGGAVVLGKEGDEIRAEASFAVLQTKDEGETHIFSAGKYVDRFVRGDGQLRLNQRDCGYETHRVETLLVTPI
jgi:anthranilate 1,2-dioxygenase small subunit